MNDTVVPAYSPSGTRGFSLIEVIVALVMVATLSLAYIGLQHRSMDYVEDIEARLEHVNFAQEYLIDNPFFTEHEPSRLWIGDRRDRQWRIDIEPEGDISRVRLQTRYDKRLMTWKWIAE
jgi:prepilin-type N-terminal cleavage/methylation domain-containing protein